MKGKAKRIYLLVVVVFSILSLYGIVLSAEGDVQALIAKMDEIWAKRGDQDSVEKAIEVGKSALNLDPNSYEAAWRIAMAYWWIGQQRNGDKEARKAVGFEGMKYGELAIRLNDERPEGHLMYALGVGNYSYGVSIVKAILQGLAPKFERAALKAYELDKHFDEGAPMVVLGRYYQQMPWPMKDLKKSLQYLEEAKRFHPNNLRGRLHLAETYLDLGEKEKAKAELAFVLQAQPSPKREVEDAFVKKLARQDFAKWFPGEKVPSPMMSHDR